MSQFEVHTIETAPEASRPALTGARTRYGALFNLFGVLGESPVALKAYAALGELLEDGSLSPEERQLVLLAISVANRCEYCVAAHSVAAKLAGLDDQTIRAVRQGVPLEDERLAALSTFVVSVVEKRGWLSNQEVDGFLLSGFTREQILEVIVAVAFKTISNYTNHIAQPPLDRAFEPARWSPEEVIVSDRCCHANP